MRRSLPAALAAAALLAPAGQAAPAPRPSHDHANYGHASHGHAGLREIVLADGARFTIHGYEPRTPEWMDPLPSAERGRGIRMAPGDPERQPVCATDHYQHVLYARATTDGYADSVPRIRAAIRRMNHVLNEAALESGGRTADFKVRCDASGDIAVDAFLAVGTEFQSIVASARLAGFADPNADYTIFYDGIHPLYCGVGSFANDATPGPANRNNSGGGYAITYKGCWDSRTPMHENGHNQGAVQTEAPNSTGTGHHCNDQHDVMCYADGGSRDRGDFVACFDKMHYDCGFDTYFDARPEPGEWLWSNWNIGSEHNRFIVLGTPPRRDRGAPEPARAGAGQRP